MKKRKEEQAKKEAIGSISGASGRDAYARAGVDVHKVRDIQRSIAKTLASTFSTREGRVGSPLLGIGHYAGVIDLGDGRALAMHTDGVGTKVLVAIEMRRFDTVGIDCVAMTVNDIICLGCEPIALLDYLALEREDDHLVSEVMKGLRSGAEEAGTAIVGGETAIMGGVLRGFDLVSMGVGITDRTKILDGSRLRRGDGVVGLSSSGLHSNGYTLARKVLLKKKKRSLKEFVPELGRTLGEELLVPTRIYVKPILRALERFDIHGVGHVTGGSFSKLARLAGAQRLGFDLTLPDPIPPIFELIQRDGHLKRADMLRAFNMGVGLCVCVPVDQAEELAGWLTKAGFPSQVMGRVVDEEGVIVDGIEVTS